MWAFDRLKVMKPYELDAREKHNFFAIFDDFSFICLLFFGTNFSLENEAQLFHYYFWIIEKFPKKVITY